MGQAAPCLSQSGGGERGARLARPLAVGRDAHGNSPEVRAGRGDAGAAAGRADRVHADGAEPAAAVLRRGMGRHLRKAHHPRAGQREQSLAGLRVRNAEGPDRHSRFPHRRRRARRDAPVHRRAAGSDGPIRGVCPSAGRRGAGRRARPRAGLSAPDVPRGAAEPAHSPLHHVGRGRLSQHPRALRPVHDRLSEPRSGGGRGNAGQRLRAAGGLFPQLQPRQRPVSRHAAGRQRPEHRARRHDPRRPGRLQRPERDVPARVGGAAAHRPEDQPAREPRHAPLGLRAGHAADAAGPGLSPV